MISAPAAYDNAATSRVQRPVYVIEYPIRGLRWATSDDNPWGAPGLASMPELSAAAVDLDSGGVELAECRVTIADPSIPHEHYLRPLLEGTVRVLEGYAGSNAGAFIVLLQGPVRRLARADDGIAWTFYIREREAELGRAIRRDPDPRLPYSRDPLGLALELLTTTDEGGNGPYDRAEPGFGMGVPVDRIDVEAWQEAMEIEDRDSILFSAPDAEQSDGYGWISDHLIRPMGLMLMRHVDGRLTVVAIADQTFTPSPLAGFDRETTWVKAMSATAFQAPTIELGTPRNRILATSDPSPPTHVNHAENASFEDAHTEDDYRKGQLVAWSIDLQGGATGGLVRSDAAGVEPRDGSYVADLTSTVPALSTAYAAVVQRGIRPLPAPRQAEAWRLRVWARASPADPHETYRDVAIVVVVRSFDATELQRFTREYPGQDLREWTLLSLDGTIEHPDARLFDLELRVGKRFAYGLGTEHTLFDSVDFGRVTERRDGVHRDMRLGMSIHRFGESERITLDLSALDVAGNAATNGRWKLALWYAHARLGARWANPEQIITHRSQFAAYRPEPGDVVALSSGLVPDMRRGVEGVNQLPVQIMRRHPRPAAGYIEWESHALTDSIAVLRDSTTTIRAVRKRFTSSGAYAQDLDPPGFIAQIAALSWTGTLRAPDTGGWHTGTLYVEARWRRRAASGLHPVIDATRVAIAYSLPDGQTKPVGGVLFVWAAETWEDEVFGVEIGYAGVGIARGFAPFLDASFERVEYRRVHWFEGVA